MRRRTPLLLAGLVISGLGLDARADELDDRMEAQLRALSEPAVEVWRAANAAREREDFAAADAGYLEVLALAPSFTHAVRRRCGLRLAQGDRAGALELCEAAYAAADIPENAAGLAMALVFPPQPGEEPNPADLTRALTLARGAAVADDAPPHRFTIWCEASLRKDDLQELGHCGRRFTLEHPDEALGHFFLAVHVASNGNLDEADERLDLARAKGLDEDTYQRAKSAFESGRPLPLQAWHLTKRWGGLWLAGLVLLIAAGFGLSRATLSAATRASSVQSAEVKGLEAWLRRLYGGVLWLTCLYYYASLPIVLASIVLTAGGIIYFFFAIGHIPIKLVLVVGVIGLVSVFSVLNGVVAVFRSGKDEDPGERLDLDAHPRLREALHEVAAKVGTRPVDNVYVEPGCNIAVFERGSLLAQLRGRTERCLILGIAVLDDMPLPALKAILAHEYGHFHNEDTAGGGFALGVRRSMGTMAVSLIESGAAAWYNPAWLFFRGFHWVFMHVSQGASRLQEILADRWAALAYGSNAFVTGLEHAIRRDVQFDAHVADTMYDVMQSKRAAMNFYTYAPTTPTPPEKIEEAVQDILQREPEIFDSHPAPKDRIAWVQAMAIDDASPASPPTLAWSLFSDPEALQAQLTREVRHNVYANHGVDIFQGLDPDASEAETTTEVEAETR